MKIRFLRWYNALLTALLSILGYGCSSEGPEEYGCPHADYIIKGTVTDEAGTPIQGIKTTLKNLYGVSPQNGQVLDSFLTDDSGKYQVYDNGMESSQTKLIVEDIDGEENGGEFLSDTLDINHEKAVQTKEGDGRWYQGSFEITQDVKLKKKQ
jgi:putative lipoprotein (rSAM/lipoprotein system)